MQPAFAGRILRGAKEMGIHTAIDTSGFLGRAASDEMLQDVDLVLLDVKSGNPDTYLRTDRAATPANHRLWRPPRGKGIEIWIRFVLVPGWTDDPDNIRKVADIVTRWGSVSRVEVLPFHQMGRDKWISLGMEYKLDDVKPPSMEATEAARDIFREYGLTVH